jgi:ferric-dicitrate binding protein FerR (iron transport regulator)
VRHRLAEPPRRSPALWGAALGVPVVLLFAAWMNAGERVAAPPPAARPLAIALGGAPIVEAAPGVRLAVDGAGDVSGTERDVVVSWRAGTLGVDVQPDAGIALRVETPEGVARVVGTGFDVRREAFGTSVIVRHGIVEVACAGEVASRLVAGESRSCLPSTAAGLLGRARAQQRAGVAPDEVLVTLQAALDRSPDRHVRDELRVARIDVLVRAGRHRDALAEARAYVDDPGSSLRRSEIDGLVRELSAIVEAE